MAPNLRESRRQTNSIFAEQVHVLRGAAEDVSAGSTAPGAAAEDVPVGSWAPGAPEDVPMHYVPPGAAVDVSAGAVAGHSWR